MQAEAWLRVNKRSRTVTQNGVRQPRTTLMSRCFLGSGCRLARTLIIGLSPLRKQAPSLPSLPEGEGFVPGPVLRARLGRPPLPCQTPFAELEQLCVSWRRSRLVSGRVSCGPPLVAYQPVPASPSRRGGPFCLACSPASPGGSAPRLHTLDCSGGCGSSISNAVATVDGPAPRPRQRPAGRCFLACPPYYVGRNQRGECACAPGLGG